MITTMPQALASLPWHFIAIIGRERGLGIDSNLSKAELAAGQGSRGARGQGRRGEEERGEE